MNQYGEKGHLTSLVSDTLTLDVYIIFPGVRACAHSDSPSDSEDLHLLSETDCNPIRLRGGPLRQQAQ